jgi:hypothetical protein
VFTIGFEANPFMVRRIAKLLWRIHIWTS